MEENIERKIEAIIQSLANLRIDGIILDSSYFSNYKAQILNDMNEQKKLILKMEGNNGKHK